MMLTTFFWWNRQTMVSSSKNARIGIYCSFVVAYTIFIMKFGVHLLLPFASMSSLMLETRPLTNNHMRHTLDENEGQFSRKMMKSGRSHDFTSKFIETLLSNRNSANNFSALFLKGDKVYCRKSQVKDLSRGKYFVQMLRRGLMQYPNQTTLVDETTSEYSFPILIKHDDSNGCYPASNSDKYGFPRLTWSIPANVTGQLAFSSPAWCSAVGMPSYKMWRDLKNDAHKNFNDAYPWNAKIPKAVWRGSTTANNGLYGHLPLLETPRSRLVRFSLERPDLIDAGFHKLVGKYENASVEYNVGSMMKDVLPFKQMMSYKAIIDIDGNNWSARFPSLLCTNSIIVKITPDFVEQITQSLQPNVHYMPASLENLTTVVEYIMDENNDGEMKMIVSNANRWCHSNLRKDSLAKSAIDSLETYLTAIHQDDMKLWASDLVKEQSVGDLVECSV